MKRRIGFIRICLLLCCFLTIQGYSQIPQSQRFHTGLSIGFGLPKMPFSHFRMPVSILGGGALNYRLSNKWCVQADGYGLYTFSLGTVTGREGKLRFNLAWVSLDLLRHFRGALQNENFILVGFGYYYLSQQFDDDEDILNTTGFSLGMVDWRHWKRWSMFTEIRWHLLFHPSPKPQVFTVTLGILL